MVDSYRRLGVVLMVTGLIIILFSSLVIEMIPLASLGISAVILGMVSISLSRLGSDISYSKYPVHSEVEPEDANAIDDDTE